MTDDIVERLYEWQDHKDGGESSDGLYLALGDAADEIERLRQLGDQLAYRALEECRAGELISAAKAWQEARRG